MDVAGVCFLGVFAATERRQNLDYQNILLSRDLACDGMEILGTVSALFLGPANSLDEVSWDST